jgi:LacI family transcriptional regulator
VKTNITMKDIADKLGVSVVTVSKALNDKDGVGGELKAKIKQIAHDIGYRFNTSAKSMKEGLSYNIGVIIPERFAGPNQSFYLQFYQQISKVLGKFHYYGILNILSTQDEAQLSLPKLYSEKKVDGFIILGQISNAYIELLQGMDTPYVFLDFYTNHAEVDSIISDSYYGVYEMTNYLISKGHRDIAFVGNIRSTSSIQDRFLGYYKSLLEHHIPMKESYIISDRDERGMYIDFVLPDKMPTAFVCNCDQVAYNLINKLNKNGYSVPNDCSVVGFDNDLYASISEPQLTTIEVDIEEMSRMAVKSVIKKLKNQKDKYGRIMINCKIVYRDSVKALK